ncbi:hypothetical protein ABH920_002962 [Catenulispora sp. EB89]|uniref:hypothetical protein n=1 Tax=Catenulispora sp. EB89 TaxID=3156257 RepID=UPI00351872A1
MAKWDRDGTEELLRKWRRQEKRRKRVAFFFRPVSWLFKGSPGLAMIFVAAFVLALAFFLGALAGSCQPPCRNTCVQGPG